MGLQRPLPKECALIKTTEPEITVSVVVVIVGIVIIGGMYLIGALLDMQASTQHPYYGSHREFAPDTVQRS